MTGLQNGSTAKHVAALNNSTQLYESTFGNIEQTAQFDIRKAISISPGLTLNPKKFKDDTYFLILRGLVGKIDTRISQRRKLASVHYAGDLICLNPPHYLPTIYTALTPAKVIPIKKAVFYESLQQSHEFCTALYFQIVSESSTTFKKARNGNSKRAQRIVCKFLMDSLARESVAQHKKKLVEFPFNNALLAEFLNLPLTQLQAITRLLTDLKIITVLSEYNISIKDTNKLRMFYAKETGSNVVRLNF